MLLIVLSVGGRVDSRDNQAGRVGGWCGEGPPSGAGATGHRTTCAWKLAELATETLRVVFAVVDALELRHRHPTRSGATSSAPWGQEQAWPD